MVVVVAAVVVAAGCLGLFLLLVVLLGLASLSSLVAESQATGVLEFAATAIRTFTSRC